jgi:hypothetical protein
MDLNGAGEWSAFEVLCENGNFPIELMRRVIRREGKANKRLFEAASHCSPRVVEACLAAGADPTQPNLPVAALGARRPVEVLELLRMAGADLRARNAAGLTLYETARRKSRGNVLAYLCEIGADANAENDGEVGVSRG